MKHFHTNIQGWFFAEYFFADIVKNAPDGAHFVEVGSWKGKSAVFMAVEIANSGKRIKFDCIDHWKGSKDTYLENEDQAVKDGNLFEVFKENIEPVQEYINAIDGDSAATASRYADGSLDFIYIDAAHDYESVKRDIKAWLPKLKSDGVIAGDDFTEAFPGLVQAVQEIFPQGLSVIHPTWVVDRRTINSEQGCSIIFRCHTGDNVHDGVRFAGVSKTELVVKCFKSIVSAAEIVNRDIEIVIVDDHSEKKCIEALEDVLTTSRHPHKIIHVTDTGNKASLRESFEYARDYGKELVYFVEDDYLHLPTSLLEMIEQQTEFKNNLNNKEVAFYPVDYPDRYQPQGIYQSMIVLGKHRHWRTTRHSTLTFFSSRKAVFEYWELFEKMWQGEGNFVDEDQTVNKLWGPDIQLFSPIPTLAIHMQFEEHKPPFVDWQKYWDAIQ
ncbi:MAG: class I SAM-dependent methyltransferase [Patescibacteria group bacterium]